MYTVQCTVTQIFIICKGFFEMYKNSKISFVLQKKNFKNQYNI